jgi:acyl transferase domain-containing protein
MSPRPAAVPVFSTVTGGEHAGGGFDREYWGRNLTQPVRFADAMQELIAAGHDVFLEIGPHPVLGMPIAQCLAHAGREGSVLCSLRRDE